MYVCIIDVFTSCTVCAHVASVQYVHMLALYSMCTCQICTVCAHVGSVQFVHMLDLYSMCTSDLYSMCTSDLYGMCTCWICTLGLYDNHGITIVVPTTYCDGDGGLSITMVTLAQVFASGEGTKYVSVSSWKPY